MVDDAAVARITKLVFDKPFLFVLAGRDGSVLFSGVIRNLE